MAGFISKDKRNFLNIAQERIRNAFSDTLSYNDAVIKQSQAIGVKESEYQDSVLNYMDSETAYALGLMDTHSTKYIPFYDKGYPERRNYLRTFALNSEIDSILTTLADEAIVSDDRGFFCNVDTSALETKLSDDKKDELINVINESFNKICNAPGFQFKDSNRAWSLFKKFLIDGFIAFEIIYDEDVKNIIGFKEILPESLTPGVKPELGQNIPMWIQYENDPSRKRELYDNQVLLISYANNTDITRTSYTENLIRSFNLLRIVENSTVIWTLMNGTYRMKMVVPVGSLSPQKARQKVSELRAMYKEDIQLDPESGQVSVNGKPTLQLYKNYIFPSKEGETIDIDTIGGDGPDLSDPSLLEYYQNKLKKDSKIPFSRFDKEGDGGTFSVQADGLSQDEAKFARFINRLRGMFREIIMKPLIIQILLQYPELQDDDLFKSSIAIKFNENNIFEELKRMEIMQRRVDYIQMLAGLEVPLGDGDFKPYFDTEWLIDKYLHLNHADIEANKLAKEKNKSEKLDDDFGDIDEPSGRPSRKPSGRSSGGRGGRF